MNEREYIGSFTVTANSSLFQTKNNSIIR